MAGVGWGHWCSQSAQLVLVGGTGVPHLPSWCRLGALVFSICPVGVGWGHWCSQSAQLVLVGGTGVPHLSSWCWMGALVFSICPFGVGWGHWCSPSAQFQVFPAKCYFRSVAVPDNETCRLEWRCTVTQNRTSTSCFKRSVSNCA